MHTELANVFAPTPVVFIDSIDHILNIEEWLQEGKPHEWLMVEESNGYQAWIDFGHGIVALTKGDEFVGSGKYQVVGVIDHEHVVLLDKEYYGNKNYLFFSA